MKFWTNAKGKPVMECEHLGAGEYLLTSDALMVGKGTDLQLLFYRLSLTKPDVRFLKQLRINPETAGDRS